MNRRAVLTTLSVATAALLVGASARTASAQNKGKHSRSEVDGIIRDLDYRTTAFRGSLDRALDRSRLNGSKKEDKLNDAARDLERALDVLKRDMKQHQNYWDVRDDVMRALDAARPIEKAMQGGKINDGDIERDWRAVRKELNRVADVYELPRV